MLDNKPFNIQDDEESSENTNSHVPNFTVLLLATQVILSIALVAFYGSGGSNSNLFYLFTLGYIMLWSLYFAWHSLVKENGYELLAFLFLTLLTNSEGIYFLFTNSVPPLPKYLYLIYFIALSIAYPLLCYKCYHHFGLSTLVKLSTTSQYSILRSIQDYELFISGIQITFMFNSLVIFTFLYYISDTWKSFSDLGVALSVLGFCVITFHSCLGIWAATKESVKGLKAFLIALPFIQIFLGWMIVETELSPAKHIYYILFQQELFISALNAIGCLSILYLGYKNLKSCGNNRYSLIKRTNNTFLKSLFI